MARAMYSALMGWIVSLMTIFTISAEAGKEKKKTAAIAISRNVIGLDEECIGPSLRSG